MVFDITVALAIA